MIKDGPPPYIINLSSSVENLAGLEAWYVEERIVFSTSGSSITILGCGGIVEVGGSTNLGA